MLNFYGEISPSVHSLRINKRAGEEYEKRFVSGRGRR